MSEMASVLHTFGMIEGPLGPLIVVLGILMARNPRFPQWLCVSMQYIGISLTLAGAIAYFQPFGVEMSQHAVALILMAALVLIGLRYRRSRDVAKGNPQP